MQRGSLNETTDSTKLIDDSMQSLEASNLSLKLDTTQGSETALSSQNNEIKKDQSHSNEIATLVLQEKSHPSINRYSARIEDNQSPAEDIPTLDVHESTDEADDTETAKTEFLYSNDLSVSEAQSSNLKEPVKSKEAAGLSEEPSARPKEVMGLSSELSAVPKGGLLIQESDEESTDMSDNETMKSDIAGSGFFSPDLLLRKYDMKKFDGASETDRSDGDIPFSPGVVQNSRDVARSKQVMRDDNEGGGGNEENSKKEDGTSQDYMLMPTQAYGIMDSDSDGTDVEDIGIADGNLRDKKCDDFPASMADRQMKENRSGNPFSKIDETSIKAQMQDTLPLESSLSGEQTAATVPMGLTMSLEATVPIDMCNESTLSNKLSPSKGISSAGHRIASIDKSTQMAETIALQDSWTTELSMRNPLSTSALLDSMQEGDTISMHDSEAWDNIMDKNASQLHSEAKLMSDGEQEAATVVVSDSDQEAGTVLLEDADEHPRADPMRDIERVAATLLLQDNAQDAATAPVHDDDQKTVNVSLPDSAQDTVTVPVHGSDQDVSTLPLQDSVQEAATVSGHGSDQDVATVPLQDSVQEAATVSGHGSDQDVSTVPLQDSVQEAATVSGHGSHQDVSTVPLQDNVQEAATVSGHDSDQEAMTVQFQGTSSFEETVPLAETTNFISDDAMQHTSDLAPIQEGQSGEVNKTIL